MIRTVGVSGAIDTSDFSEFAKALRTASPIAYRALRARLRIAGNLVGNDYRFLVSPFSKTVPPTILVSIKSGLSVSVGSGGPGVPMAGLLELGNEGSTSNERFRHPVFGNKAVWVSQEMHPALSPAVEANIEQVQLLVLGALDEALHEAATGG